MDAPAWQRTWAELHHALQGLRERPEGHYRGQPLYTAGLSRGLAAAHPPPPGAAWSPAAPGGGVGTGRPTWRERRVGGQARPEAGSREPAGWCWDRQAGLLSQEDGPVEPALWTCRDRAWCSKAGSGPSLAPTPRCQTMHRAAGPQGPRWSRAIQNPVLHTLHSGMGQNT